MRKTVDLVNEVVALGVSKERALEDIDASLDEIIGYENRQELAEETISDELYEDILDGFKQELDA